MNIKETVHKLGEGLIRNIGEDKLFILSSYSGNPIIRPEELGLKWVLNNKLYTGAVFNGGACIFKNKIILMPRCHKNYIRKSYYDEKIGIYRYYMDNYMSRVCILESIDGISFRYRDRIILEGIEDDDFKYGIEDIRIIKFLSDEYFLIGCGKKIPPFKGSGGDRIAIYTTKDFKEIRYRGVIEPFDSRNSVIFPEYIDNKLYMIFRFHPNIHVDYLKYDIEQLYNPKKYNEDWIRIYKNRARNILLESGKYQHENEKIGAGPPPIKTREGWLLIYHSVGYIDREVTSLYGLSKDIKRGYSISAAILDINDPTKVLYRTKYPLYIPNKPWEYEGNKEYPIDIPYVVFPTGIVQINNKILLYAGSGDKYMILLSADIDYLIDYIIKYGERLFMDK